MVPASQMFRKMTDKYTAWDEATGLPTKDMKGLDISKKQNKKNTKLLEAQKKLNAEFGIAIE